MTKMFLLSKVNPKFLKFTKTTYTKFLLNIFVIFLILQPFIYHITT